MAAALLCVLKGGEMTQVVENQVVEDTAVEEQPENAAPVEDAQPQEIAPETPEQEAPEPEGEPAPETESRPSLADFDDDTLRSDERIQALIKDQLAREQESNRRKTEQETMKRLRQQVEHQVNSGQWLNTIQGALETKVNQLRKKIEDGENLDSRDLMFDSQSIQDAANSVYWRQIYRGLDAWNETLLSTLPKDAKFSTETTENLTTLSQRVGAGDVQAIAPLMQAQLSAYREALEQELEPQLRKKFEAERKKEEEAAKKTSAQRAADAARQAVPEPSGTGGSSVSGRTPDQILDDPSASWDDRRKAFEAKYGAQSPV